ncbi:MAG: penicillin acylase family protein, partial [Gammaproteobacteria bacterium]|nr:penicillin acylase family protein [Gammaproteobacteria bacterium]
MRLVRRLFAGLLVLMLLAAVSGYVLLRASLPQLDGRMTQPALRSETTIERDKLGVVTVIASSRNDAAFATGFVHGQERFFQMDLQRRVGAGELSALLGPGPLPLDRANRLHRFRARAQRMLQEIPADDAALYQAYTDGVNAGLGSLSARPFEYFLLGQKPEPWRVEDILLTVFSMYFELNDENASRESSLGVLNELLNPETYRWLIQSGTDWDAPIRGDIVAPAPLPGRDALDLRKLPPEIFKAARTSEDDGTVPGSNSWAVSASRTSNGRALLAGDMHLGHAVPNIWFRVRIVVNGDLDITGVTLPGTPLVVVGSNRHIAWSFTNSYGDWEDLVLLDIDPDNPDRYRTADGWREFTDAVEQIAVRDGEAVELPLRETIWGPVIDEDFRGRLRALRWLPHLPEATNAGIVQFEQARTVAEAIATANRVGGPPQNYVVADVRGHIGWTIMGQIPRRIGFNSALPSSWVDGAGWQGWIEPEEYPRIIDPPDGLLWTANARTVDGDWLAMLGEGNHPVGARPRQIRDGLRARGALTIMDMLAIQLDDRAWFLDRWRDLLLQLLSRDVIAENSERRELRRLVAAWGGHAAVDSAGYRLVRAFRLNVIDSVTGSLLASVREQVPDFQLLGHSQLERPVWQLITQRPPHLLNPNYTSWKDFLIEKIDATINYYSQ